MDSTCKTIPLTVSLLVSPPLNDQTKIIINHRIPSEFFSHSPPSLSLSLCGNKLQKYLYIITSHRNQNNHRFAIRSIKKASKKRNIPMLWRFRVDSQSKPSVLWWFSVTRIKKRKRKKNKQTETVHSKNKWARKQKFQEIAGERLTQSERSRALQV